MTYKSLNAFFDRHIKKIVCYLDVHFCSFLDYISINMLFKKAFLFNWLYDIRVLRIIQRLVCTSSEMYVYTSQKLI